MEQIKFIWPKWEVLEVLGQGGFGTVYKAKRDNFGDVTYAAIKVVKIPSNRNEVKEMTGSGLSEAHIKEYYRKSVLNLVDEIKMMSKFKTASHIVSIEDFEVAENSDGIGGTIYIRMELLKNIADHFDLSNINKDDVVKMAVDILTALEFCHNLNVVHRDIKPGNIFISEFGEYKLGDFGISRVVEKTNATMSQKGTKSYMAPEMIRMEKYGKNVDLYALGLTMYELLNHGRIPFLPPFPELFYPMDREEAMIKRLMGEEFPDIEGLGELNVVIKKACHPNPNERYQSATEMKKDLVKASLDFVDDKRKVNVDYVEKDKTENVFGGGLFDKDKTENMFGNGLFDHKEKNDVIAEDRDKTIGVFGNGLFDHIDVKKEKTDKDVHVEKEKEEVVNKEKSVTDMPYTSVHRNSRAYLVFNHGYYNGIEVFITKDDEKTNKLKTLFEEYLSSQNKKQVLKQMIDLDDSAQLHYQLGKEYYRTSSKEYAKEEYKKAYELDPNDGTIAKAMALVCFEEKEYKKAYDIIQHSIKQCHQLCCSKKDTLLYAYASKSIICQKLKKYDEALESLVKAYQYVDNYKFKFHKIPATALLTETTVLSFLYDIWNEEKFEQVHYLGILSDVYSIGTSIYKDIVNNELHHYSKSFLIKLRNKSLPCPFKDEYIMLKDGFNKAYYYGYLAAYCYDGFSWFYFSYMELSDCHVDYLENAIILTKNNTDIKLPVSKKDSIVLFNIIKRIRDKNNELLSMGKGM